MSESSQFLGLESPLTDYKTAKIVVAPCPYEKTTSYLTGTVNGPAAILTASHQVEYFDTEVQTEACKQGIHTYAPFDYTNQEQDKSLEQTEQAFEQFFKDGKFPILLGGEHTITIAPVRAASKVFWKRLVGASFRRSQRHARFLSWK